jgi:hypothetical protein
MRAHVKTVSLPVLALVLAQCAASQRIRINTPSHQSALDLAASNGQKTSTSKSLNSWISRLSWKRKNFDTNPNGTTFLWLPSDEYSGKTFFEYVLSL